MEEIANIWEDVAKSLWDPQTPHTPARYKALYNTMLWFDIMHSNPIYEVQLSAFTKEVAKKYWADIRNNEELFALQLFIQTVLDSSMSVFNRDKQLIIDGIRTSFNK